jgi:succinate dehydrogenase / fumarate reductase, iron-sulfur subunit
MNITITIERYNPGEDSEPYEQSYPVSVTSEQRVLDALIEIKRHQDATLGFRYSCAHGVCGSDAMRINGRERLACKTLVKDVASQDGDVVKLQPLRHFRVERDLMVDQDGFFQKYRNVHPYLFARAPVAKDERREQLQSIDERALFDDATKCILCGACYSACPVPAERPSFIGPAALVQAARFVNDSRDQGLEPRLEALDHADGVWACEGHFECTRVCPREIKVTKLINQMKRQIRKHREARDESTAEPKAEQD